MKKQIESKGRVNNKHMNDILRNIMKHRVPFDTFLSTWIIFFGCMKSGKVVPCICPSKKYRNQKLYENGSNRFIKETDIISILKSVRLFKLYLSSITD
jgi:hypothetical protein